MSAEEVKKVMAVQWEEKEPYCMPHGYQYKLENVDNYLKEMDELLLEAGMEGLGYQSQAENIQKTALGMGLLNAYISTLMSEIDAQIDQPLYRGFQNEATEQLSRIRMEDYSTENTLGLKRHYKIHDAYGQIMEYDAQAVSLTMKDFLGLTSLNDNAGHGDLIGMPKEFSDFTNLFAVEYDKIKDNLKDETGKEVTLEEYLTYLNTKGEFDNKMDKPLQELISAILDVTIIKPLIEMCTGYDMITGEDLTDFERGLKGVFAVVDVVTLFVGIKASGVAKLFSREALETGGRIIATDLISNGTAYAVGKMGEELGLPLPITLMLSLGAGVTVSLAAGKYVFKDSAGNVVLEAGEDEVDEIRTQIKQGVETGSDALKSGGDTSFTWKLRGEGVTLNDVKVQEISYVKRSSTELKTLRDEFNTTARKAFLEHLGKNAEYLRNAGFSETDILKIQNGRVPDGWQVHHKLPLDDSGTNSFYNLVLIQNEPYHKVITNYQNSIARQMEIGEAQVVQWPMSDGNIYPAQH